jgi:glutamate synthase (NADPH) small chain
MGKVTGFLEIEREGIGYRPVAERLHDYREVTRSPDEATAKNQSARCMECGVPFCHGACPLNNLIPDFNDLVWKGRWREASRVLHSTNNFPEFTGWLCPAPCEASCVLDIGMHSVSTRLIERAIVERAWTEGWIPPEPPSRRTGVRIAVVGAGPAGLAAAQQLTRAGHSVTLFDQAEQPGGLLRYGIPDFKFSKAMIDRRVAQLVAEGLSLRLGTKVGEGALTVNSLQLSHDIILLTGGAGEPRDLKVPGRELSGIHFAVPYLAQQNRRQAGLVAGNDEIVATGKRVVIIGGGDTGADCLGTSLRQGAESVHQLELMPKPPSSRPKETPWPNWPLVLRCESSHQEGGHREFGVSTLRFSGDTKGRVTQLHAVRVGPPPRFEPIANSEFALPCDLVLLAMGFVGPARPGAINELGLRLDARGLISTEDYMTSTTGVFAAGDMRRGQSLIAWAINEGRQAARAIERFLAKSTPARSIVE